MQDAPAACRAGLPSYEGPSPWWGLSSSTTAAYRRRASAIVSVPLLHINCAFDVIEFSPKAWGTSARVNQISQHLTAALCVIVQAIKSLANIARNWPVVAEPCAPAIPQGRLGASHGHGVFASRKHSAA